MRNTRCSKHTVLLLLLLYTCSNATQYRAFFSLCNARIHACVFVHFIYIIVSRSFLLACLSLSCSFSILVAFHSDQPNAQNMWLRCQKWNRPHVWACARTQANWFWLRSLLRNSVFFSSQACLRLSIQVNSLRLPGFHSHTADMCNYPGTQVKLVVFYGFDLMPDSRQYHLSAITVHKTTTFHINNKLMNLVIGSEWVHS